MAAQGARRVDGTNRLPKRPSRLGRRLRALRSAIRARPHLRLIYRVLIATLGALVVVIGLVLVPLPGPGWLIVFAGLGILGTEFVWAHRIASRLKRVIDRVLASWARRRAARRAAVRTSARVS